MKARNKIDNRIYAVKKIRLKTQQSDTKIFREVNALSRLSHRFIVRYYTTWVETSENTSGGRSVGGSTFASSDESSESPGVTFSVPSSSSPSPTTSKSRSTDGDEEDVMDHSASTVSERHLPTNAGFTIDMADFDATTTEISGSRGSFPSIHFDRSGSPGGSTEESDEGSSGTDESDFGALFQRDPVTGATNVGTSVVKTGRPRTGTMTAGNGKTEMPPFGLMSGAPSVTRTLYIQMEFVERQTLREVRGF